MLSWMFRGRKRLECRGQAGFTLIELLIVVIIIAVLAAIAVPTYLGARIEAQDSSAFTLVRNALTTVESAYIDAGDYTAVGVAELEGIEPSISWNLASADLVDPTGPTITGIVTARAENHEVDFYPQATDQYDVACVSESGNKYGIEVRTAAGAGATYMKVKVLEGETSTNW